MFYYCAEPTTACGGKEGRRVVDRTLFLPWSNHKPRRKSEPPDKRRMKRRPVHYPAWIAFDSNRQIVSCVIRDMSDGGARLMITFPIRLVPETFQLWLDKDGKVQRECEVVWTHPPYVGVRFIASQHRTLRA